MKKGRTKRVRATHHSPSHRNRSTRHAPSRQTTHPQIVTTFLQMLNTVKLYHWTTTNYAQHKATDELYANLNANIDTFVEIMLGKTGSRVNLTGQHTLPLSDYSNLHDFTKEINKYKEFLIHININATNNSDLLNVRDEILANLNQFTYLLSFK
jgi:hypothetical protein